MVFRNIYIITIFGLFYACGPGEDKKSDAMIGDPLEHFGPKYGDTQIEQNQISYVDRHISRIHQFDLSTLAVTHSTAIPFSMNEPYIIANPASNYHILIDLREVYIVRPDGSSEKTDLLLIDEPRSASFKPDEHLIAIADQSGSVGIMRLNDQGRIEATWVGGPIINGEDSFRAGTLISGQRLVVSLSERTLAVIDLAETLEKEKWTYKTFDVPDAVNITWVAELEEEDHVLIASDDFTAIINVETEVVVAKETLGEQTYNGFYRSSAPHFYTSSLTSNENYLYYVENNQIVKKMIYKGVTSINTSILDKQAGTLTLLDTDSNQINEMTSSTQLLRYRISDQLLLAKETFHNKPHRPIITKDYLFFQYDSALGYAERFEFKNPGDIQSIKGYNFEYLR